MRVRENWFSGLGTMASVFSDSGESLMGPEHITRGRKTNRNDFRSRGSGQKGTNPASSRSPTKRHDVETSPVQVRILPRAPISFIELSLGITLFGLQALK